MTRNPITVVVGGQYGSEGKGAITGMLCRTEEVDYCVRTGGPNAGHTVEYGGHRLSFQQLPVGWVNPTTNLVIGAGALVNREILVHEIKIASNATGSNIWERLHIDYRVFDHREEDAAASIAAGRPDRLGSTGKGCSTTLRRRIAREVDDNLKAGDRWWHREHSHRVVDTEKLLNDAYDHGKRILIEGTQGIGLDLCLGPYPYTTHRQTGPAQWMMECGLSPSLDTDIVMVVRTHPIRVAGNSGPLPNETNWPDLLTNLGSRSVPFEVIERYVASIKRLGRERIGAQSVLDDYYVHQESWREPDRRHYGKVLRTLNSDALDELSDSDRSWLNTVVERTTVTKLVRRIAKLSLLDLETFARQARPDRVALTFMDYQFPHDRFDQSVDVTIPAEDFIQEVHDACRAPVEWVSAGPRNSDIYSPCGGHYCRPLVRK